MLGPLYRFALRGEFEMLVRLFFICSIGIGLPQTVIAQATPLDVKVGFSLEQLREQETVELIRETTDSLFYGAQVAGINATLIYVQYGGVVLEAVYVFEQNHMDPEVYIEDFFSVNAFLQEIFGRGFREIPGPSWHSKTSRAHLESLPSLYGDSLGVAVERGFAQYLNSWTMEDKQIQLRLVGGWLAKRMVPISKYEGEGAYMMIQIMVRDEELQQRFIKGRNEMYERRKSNRINQHDP